MAPVPAPPAPPAPLEPSTPEATPVPIATPTPNATPETLTVQAPAQALDFPQTKLDGRKAYRLRADIGDWTVTAGAATPGGWQVDVRASAPVAADDGEPARDAVMRMRPPSLPAGHGQPAIAEPDDEGFVDLNGSAAPDGVVMAWTEQDLGPGTWQLLQPESGDLELWMPYDTRPVRYTASVTFTVSPML